jgi:two-component system, cell cycle sensor histidine kinase and response regulator CckA
MESLQGSPKALSLLIVEDDKAAVESLHRTIALKYSGCTVHSAENGQAGLELYQRLLPDIVITDINMPGMNGIQMAFKIKQLNPGAEIIATTAISGTHHLMDAIKIGISRYLLKPVEFEALFESIDACIARITMERRLKAQSEFIGKLSRVIEQSTDMVVITNQEGAIEYTNPKFSEVTGYSSAEMTGKELRTVMASAAPFESFDKLRDRVQRGSAWRGEITGRKKAGELFSIEAAISPLEGAAGDGIQFVAVMQDISERKRAEAEHRLMQEQLLHVQKLESLGVLAGGIAHDFNNILMSIIGNTDLALLRINRESPAVDNLRQIEKASARAADLAKQMLAYSGKGKFVVEDLDLNVLLEEMLDMLQVSISKKAELRLNLPRNLPAVEVDATQLRQIVMNLVINASEAIGEQSGVIAITTGCMDCDQSYLKDLWLSENIVDGPYVYLEVADTGCGMTRETLARVFDPFFTTKFSGRGLGMAAVLGIVKGHQGAIRVCSEPGKGSTLKILLPASGRPAEVVRQQCREEEWRGSGTVLLVDDEETVREIGSEMLKEFGFQVITAGDGQEGIDIFKVTPGIAFVILDLTMPHLDGEQCFRELRKLAPGVKVIMTSGYNEHEVTQKFVGKGLAGFLQKPYTVSELKNMIVSLELA